MTSLCICSQVCLIMHLSRGEGEPLPHVQEEGASGSRRRWAGWRGTSTATGLCSRRARQPASIIFSCSWSWTAGRGWENGKGEECAGNERFLPLKGSEWRRSISGALRPVGVNSARLARSHWGVQLLASPDMAHVYPGKRHLELSSGV